MKNYIQITTPLNVVVSVSEEYWEYIIHIKHKIMQGKEKEVIVALSNPDEIRKSKADKTVYLYYKKSDKLYCVVAKHLNGKGFIITCYLTDRLKEGHEIWRK